MMNCCFASVVDHVSFERAFFVRFIKVDETECFFSL